MFSAHLNLETRASEAGAVRQSFLGRKLHELPTPAAIVDRRIVQAHCETMLASCRSLGVSLRAHIKTHKTLECTQMQVGASETGPEPANLIVSTLAEIEIILPWLLQLERKGRPVNVLYSMPLPLASIAALNAYAERFTNPGTIAIMVDHPQHLAALDSFTRPPSVFLKLDTGTHRAGLPADSPEFAALAERALGAQSEGKCRLVGVYSHASHSYASRDATHAMQDLLEEIEGCLVAERILRMQRNASTLKGSALVLSVGATPTATSAQNLTAGVHAAESTVAKKLRDVIESIRANSNIHRLELHAGVYPFLDLQQLSTQAAPSSASSSASQSSAPTINIADIAMTILAEVASVYPNRSPPQALIAAGSLALGREPCPRYTGFGAISDWYMPPEQLSVDASGWGGPGRSGWAVGKVSQEHGVLMPEAATAWEGSNGNEDLESKTDCVPFAIGQKVRVLPNHACIAGANHAWYFVVDGGDEVVDIWQKCHFW